MSRVSIVSVWHVGIGVFHYSEILLLWPIDGYKCLEKKKQKSYSFFCSSTILLNIFLSDIKKKKNVHVNFKSFRENETLILKTDCRCRYNVKFYILYASFFCFIMFNNECLGVARRVFFFHFVPKDLLIY